MTQAPASAPTACCPSATRPPRPLWHWLALAACLIVLDQASKYWVLTHYAHGQGTVITGFFNIVRAHNSGAAFSFLAGAGGWQRWLFVAIALAVSAFVLWQLRKNPAHPRYCLALACFLGGGLGNMIDRLLHGHVVDFLDFHYSGWHYPAFNVADIAICTGAALLVFEEVLRSRKPTTNDA